MRVYMYMCVCRDAGVKPARAYATVFVTVSAPEGDFIERVQLRVTLPVHGRFPQVEVLIVPDS